MLIEVIWRTTSAGECRSIRRLWMRICGGGSVGRDHRQGRLQNKAYALHTSKASKVLVPLPQGDLRTVRRRTCARGFRRFLAPALPRGPAGGHRILSRRYAPWWASGRGP